MRAKLTQEKCLRETLMDGTPTDEAILMAVEEFAPKLLSWYAEHGRDLPWRVKGGPHPDPYKVWISEIMLQQTTVVTVIPYFARFMERFPDLPSLAAASVDDVLHLWQGLGYYRRAHQMHACARVLLERYGGVFPRPSRPEDLLELPGIGPYTAASIAALAFGIPAAVVDGNVERILSRLHCLDVPVKTVKDRVAGWARSFLPREHIADYTSAIMDLGATVCRPKKPACLLCPWREGCCAFARNTCEAYPVKQRKEKPLRRGYVFWLEDEQGRVLVQRRPQGGLLSGLWEFPWTEVAEEKRSGSDGMLEAAVASGIVREAGDAGDAGVLQGSAGLLSGSGEMLLFEGRMLFETGEPGPVRWEVTEHVVRHTFTHFHLALRVVRGCVNSEACRERSFVAPGEFSQYAFSRLMGKVMEVCR